MTKRIIITVDGLAGSGKTTISQLLAKKLGFAHLNSGILYRGVGFLCNQNALVSSDSSEVCKLIKEHVFKLVLKDSSSRLLLDGKDITDLLYEDEVSQSASRNAAIPEVRADLIEAQREAFEGYNLVAEGRDMGTVVFPDAELKFFVDVDVEIRAKRRMEQLVENRGDFNPEAAEKLYEETIIAIRERDERDSSRAVSPTVAATDAVKINNSGQTLTQVVQNMYDLAANKGLVGS